MRSRAVRLTLTLLAVLAIPAAAWFIWDIAQQEQARQVAVARFESVRTAALRDVSELRAAQQAYVAAGQSEAYWFDKVSSLSDSIRGSLDTLTAAAPFAAVQNALAPAIEGFDGFERADRRARNYAASGQKLLASDIVFSDGLNAISRIISSLEQAGAVVAQENQARTASVARAQLMPLSAAAAVMLVVVLMMTPLPAADDAATRVDRASEAAEPAGSLELRPRTSPAASTAVTPAPTEKAITRSAEAAAAAAAPAPPAPPMSNVDVQGLAALCTDLARLSDTDRLPSILERTARTLDASGLILWVADPDGIELVPVAAHGYPASVLARLGTITADAENATAAAFRTGLLQTVGARDKTSGAIAAPLVTSSGCRGVMSAEVRNDGEKQRGRLAAASIVAAQLATLIGPLPAAAADGREAAM